ncbi:MAG: methyltransferase domain-containing protein [Bacteroidota bacterium]
MDNNNNNNNDHLLDAAYWKQRYQNNDAIWDIGSASPAIATFLNQLTQKEISILIPGCGNSYEAELLIKNDFKNVHLLDYAAEPLRNFAAKNPSFPEDHLHCEDFFHHNGTYDLIIEQTFFCALNPSLRKKYVEKMYSLLKPSGRLAGLLFNCEFEKEGPPFGGNENEYRLYFEPLFEIKMEPCYNSIPKREGRELFIILQKRVLSHE